MTASVGITAVLDATVVAAAVAVAVATLLLLGTAVGVVVKMGVMQTALTDSSRTARR